MRYYQEKVETDDRIPAKIYLGTSKGANCHYPLHWHDHLEFNLVLAGKIKGTINQKPVEVSEGEIFFVNSGDLHETDVDYSQEMSAVTILLSYQLLKDYCPNIDSFYFNLKESEEVEQKVKELILQCAKIYQEKEDFYELELSIALHRLGHILLTECKRSREDGNYERQELKTRDHVKKAIAYMESQYENEMSLKEIAAYIGMTPNYFARFFKQSTGETFYNYLNDIRLYYAHRELVSSDHSVSDIAYNNGFPNVKSFIETFKRTYHTTPAQYKKKIRFDKKIG